jgi:hypothetical protein
VLNENVFEDLIEIGLSDSSLVPNIEGGDGVLGLLLGDPSVMTHPSKGVVEELGKFSGIKFSTTILVVLIKNLVNESPQSGVVDGGH